MKGIFGTLMFALSVVISMAAPPPTPQETEERLLPLLLHDDASFIRMAGFDWGEPPHVSDWEMMDGTMWGELGVFSVQFRVFFTATEDLYTEMNAEEVLWESDADGENEEKGYVRIGRAGERFSIKYKFTVHRVDGKLEFTAPDQRKHGIAEWPHGIWQARTRSCWEAWGAALGKSVAFYDSEDAMRDALRRKADSRQ